MATTTIDEGHPQHDADDMSTVVYLYNFIELLRPEIKLDPVFFLRNNPTQTYTYIYTYLFIYLYTCTYMSVCTLRTEHTYMFSSCLRLLTGTII